jgi:hypothetical protein
VSEGCDQATADDAAGHNSEVVLDFGAQNLANTGTYPPFYSGLWTYADVENTVENYAAGYWACSNSSTGHTVYLDIGTNNSGSNVSTATGQKWGDVVQAMVNWVPSHVQHVVMQAGNDIEAWDSDPQQSYTNMLNWIGGYGSHTSRLVLNFGSLDGCSQTSPNDPPKTCNYWDVGGWNQNSYWYLSWGYPLAIAEPEIFTLAQAKQWHMLSAYGDIHETSEILFTAPGDQYAQCSCTFTAQQAWDNLYTQLTTSPAETQTPTYSMEIGLQ